MRPNKEPKIKISGLDDTDDIKRCNINVIKNSKTVTNVGYISFIGLCFIIGMFIVYRILAFMVVPVIMNIGIIVGLSIFFIVIMVGTIIQKSCSSNS